MSKVFYVRDTSASRRTRAIYSTEDDVTTPELYIGNVPQKRGRDFVKEMNNNNYTKWDQLSMDSGFCSDLDRKIGQLSLAGSDVGSIDENNTVRCDNDIRAPSRAKLTGEEKRLKEKIRTLPSPGRSTRWHQCDNDTENFSGDDEISSKRIPPYLPCNSQTRNQDRKSKTLPAKYEKYNEYIHWDNVALCDLKQVQVLGGGGYARVDLVEFKRQPGHRFALKKLNKRFLQERDQVSHVISEKEALRQSRSRFIPRLFKTFKSPNHVFMLTEACLGGDLFSVLERQGALHHDATRYVISCVIEALDHLHRVLNIIHRDVKTENILIDSNGTAKLADLGFCKKLPHNSDVTYTFCGTPGYVAPEVLLRTGHGRTCDFFSTGVVLFEVSTCRSPFRRHSSMETHKATLRGIKDVAFPSFINHVTVQLIRSFCYSEPDSRLGATGCEQIRRHDFFCGFDWHRLRQGKMTSPLVNLMSKSPESTSTSYMKDDYIENVGEIIKNPFDKTWNENF